MLGKLPIIISFLSFGCVLISFSGCLGASEVSSSQVSQTVREYAVMSVGIEDRVINTTYPAKVCGRQDIDVFPQVSGAVVQVSITEGQRVKEGQSLFVIDPRPYQIALRTAEANVESAKAQYVNAQLQYESKKTLFSKDIISKHELSVSENAMLASKAGLAHAEAQKVIALNNLSNTTVKSPTSGVVGLINHKKGSLISPTISRPLTTVSDNTEMYVYFSVDEKQMLDLERKYGASDGVVKNMPPVRLLLGDNSVYSESGKVESISGIVDQSTGTVTIKASFPNPKGLLRSGGSGSVIVPMERKGVIVIPVSVTFSVQDRIYVYKLVDGAARAMQIKVSELEGGEEYVVEQGLSPNDVIIAEGIGLLREGTPVKTKLSSDSDSIVVSTTLIHE